MIGRGLTLAAIEKRPLALGGENRSRCGPMRAIMPGSAASSEVNSCCTTPQPRGARAVLVEEPEVAVGPLALAGRGDRIGRIAAGDHVEDRHGGRQPCRENKVVLLAAGRIG